jgi:nitroreductase
MISKSQIRDILELGVYAPSGDNSQPWKFEVRDATIEVYNIPGKDNPVLNYKQRGSYIANGGVIENIVIAAGKFGCVADVVLSPDPADESHTARIHLMQREAPSSNSRLVDFITKRHTNRKPYENRPLSKSELEELRVSMDDFLNLGNLFFVVEERPAPKSALAAAASSIEQVVLEDRELHRLFFKDVVWSEIEEKKIRSGMFINTMELGAPQKFVFRLASHAGIIRVLNRLGFARFIAREDARLYASGAGIGALVIRGAAGPKDFLLAGRAMQRLWLTATSLGISLQPLAGLIFAAMGLEDESAGNRFSNEHRELIGSNYKKINDLLGVAKEETIAMLFRFGHAAAPSAVSSKKPPVIEFL